MTCSPSSFRSFFIAGLAVVTSLLVLACDKSTGDDGGSVVQFALDSDLAPGQEAYFCKYVRMPSAPTTDPLWVRGGSDNLGEGTHHYLLYRTRVTAWVDGMDQVIACDEHETVMKTATAYVTGGQTPHGDADFPAAAALKFQPGEILLMQGHFLNASPKPRHAHVDVELRLTPASTVEHTASTLRYYNPYIVVPPRGKSSAKASCTLKKDITLLSAAAHMHARGVAYRAYIDPQNGPPSTTPFYTTNSGLTPTFYTGFLPLSAGTTIRFECDYESSDDTTIIQGLSATNNEMCMFNAFYYPAMDPADEICADMHDNGTGSTSCIDSVTCLAACPVTDRPDFSTGDPTVGECWQRCVTQSCPNVAATLYPELTCTATKCATECAQMGDACTSCVQDKCATELNACVALPSCAVP